MLDILLSRLREEIAIDGEKGTDITTVWSYTSNIVKELTASVVSQKEPTIDENYKAFLWPHIKLLDSIEFYTNDLQKMNAISTTNATKKAKKRKAHVDDDDDYDGEEVSEEEEEEEKADFSKEKKKNAKYTKIDVTDISYNQLIENYGDNIYAIGSKELQEKQIYNKVPPGNVPSAKQMEALQVILRQRSKGLYQLDLPKILDIDQKSAGHYAKSLEERGAIFRIPVSLKGVHTNLCKHIQYKSNDGSDYTQTSEQKPYNLNVKGELIDQKRILETMWDLCKGTSNNVLFARDILYALGFESDSDAVKKWFNRSMEELSIKGYTKRGFAKVDNKGRPVTCVEVLKDAFSDASKESQNLMQVNYPIMINDTKTSGPGVCMDIPFLRQVFSLIEKAGTNGYCTKEFAQSLNCDAKRMIFKTLERLIDNSSELYPSLAIKRHYEFEGRKRQFRYFTLESYNTLVEKKDTKLVPFPETEWDEAKLREINVFEPVIHTRKHLIKTNAEFVSNYAKSKQTNQKKKRSKENETHMDDASTSEINTTERTLRPQKKAKVQNTENEAVQPNNTEQSSTNNISMTEKKPAKSVQPKKKDKETASDTSSVNKEPLTTKLTRSQLESTTTTTTTTTTTINETTKDIPSSNEVMDLDKPKAPASLPTRTENDTALEASKTKSIGKNKKQTKKSKSIEAKDPKDTRKRTLLDFFGKATKKQKTDLIPTDSKATPSSSTNAVNHDACESNEEPINLDKDTPTINEAIEPMKEVVQVESNATELEKIIEGNDDDIIVVEAGPSVVAQLTQNISLNRSKPNHKVASADSTSAHESNSTSTDAPTNVITNDNATTPENTNTNATSPATPSTTLQQQQQQPTTTPTRKRGNVNSYSELRKSVLLDIIEREEIVEVGKELRALYEEAYQRITGKKPTGTICLKTIWRTCLELDKSKEAKTKIVECTMLNGKKITRKVLVQKDIDLEGEKFNDRIELIRTTRAVMRPPNPAARFEMYEAPIEKLQDRITRMKEEILEKSDISQPEASKIVAKLNEYEHNASNSVTGQIFFKHGRDKEPKRSFWMITAINNGWLYGRMLRVKCLYNYLFDLMNKPVRLQGVDKENRILSLQSIVYNMPCPIFCQIICIVTWTDELRAYIDDPENNEKTYEDFPQSIRESLFSYSNKFAKTLRQLMCALVFLGVLIPRGKNSDQDHVHVFSELYELASEVELWDFRIKPEFTEKNSYKLETKEDVSNYWKKLQYLAIQPAPQDKNEIATWNETSAKATVTSIFNVRSWDTFSVFTKAQREILSSYVNKYKNYTPIANLNLCRKIAEEAGCTVQSVRAYYSKIQDMLDKKIERRNARRVHREANGDTIIIRKRSATRKTQGSARMINQQTKHIFTRRHYNALLKKYNHPKEDRPGKNDPSYLDNTDNIPVIDSQSDIKFKRSKRCHWTKQKDELLLYSYIILQHRAERDRFMWSPIRQVMPEAKTASCRGRIFKLLLDPFTQEYMSKCQILWKNIYPEGIQSGEIKDENVNDMVDFDLASYLEYFIRRIEQDLNKSQDITPLPASTALLQENYIVRNITLREKFFEITYHKKPTSISRLQTMYSQSFTIRAGLDEILDYPTSALEHEDDLDARKVKLIMIYCMMIFMTSKESYDPFLAYKTLANFDENLCKRAYNSLKKSGCVVTTKVSRVVPGTKYNLSAKFLQDLANIYPKNMFTQSKEYEKYLALAGRNQINPLSLNSGMMACVMDLISRNKLEVTMGDQKKQSAKIEFSNAARMIDPNLIIFDLFIKLNARMNHTEQLNENEDNYVFPLETVVFDRLLSTALSSCPKSQTQLTNDIVDYMKERGSLGSVAYELRDHFKSYKETEIQSCLDILLRSNPPLLCRVGINAERYVLTISKYIASWTIFKDMSTLPSNTKEPLYQDLVAIKPALWTDINGNITSVLFNDCCETVVGWIINKPGITAASLHRFLNGFISRVELTRILHRLVEQKVIKALSVCQQANSTFGLFSKTRLSRVSKSANFQRNVETSYWILPGYYNKLSE